MTSMISVNAMERSWKPRFSWLHHAVHRLPCMQVKTGISTQSNGNFGLDFLDDFGPEGAVGTGGQAVRGECGDRGSLHGHALDQGESGDRGRGHPGPFGRKVFDYLLVQLLAAVHHGEERADLGAAAAEAGHELGELVQR